MRVRRRFDNGGSSTALDMTWDFHIIMIKQAGLGNV